MTIDPTSRDGLATTIDRMEQRLAADPADGDAVVRLAQALIRVQRVDSDPQAVVKAEQRLRAFLSRSPDHYEAQRVLGAVLLSQHRFRDAMREADRAREQDPRDTFNDGVIGDARARARRVRSRRLRRSIAWGSGGPGPPAYARVAYALELRGDLEGALDSMRMARRAPARTTPKARRGIIAQLGHLLLQPAASATRSASSSARRSRSPIIRTRWPVWRA